MPVYVGPLSRVLKTKKWRWPQACHMVADTGDELDAMAEMIGLDLRHKQKPLTYQEHFDLNESYRKRAIIAGAKPVTEHEVGRVIQKKRDTHGHQ